MNSHEQKTIDRLHGVSMEEFLEKGFQNASLRNIAKAAGVTTGALYGYYDSKEALFDALVRECYEHFMSRYKRSLETFAQRPAEKQPENMGKDSQACMKELLAYMYAHRDAFHLLLCCSAGTRYAAMIDEIAELEVEATHKYCGVLRKLGFSVPAIDSRLEHILVTGMMNAYFEMIIHDMPMKDALVYLEELNDFYTAGWMKIMGQ